MTILLTFFMSRQIIHLDLDTFFVSCERLLDRKLQKLPVLIGGTSDRGVVASCSYETREYGVHSGMPMRMARLLCPEAVVIRGNSGVYSKFSDMVTDIIRESSPVFEKSSIDEFYIDATGMDRFFGCYKWAQELRERIIDETHLPISFALSINKTVSKVGTSESKPNGYTNIPDGFEKSYLAPLSVKKIPMVGTQTYHLLRSMGIEKVKTVQEMPVELMESIMGKNGISLWRKAQGVDNSPVEPWSERKSISSERTFDQDSTDIAKMKSILVAMAESLAYQLRSENKLTACVTIKIRYSDFQTYSKQCMIPYTSLDRTLITTTLNLFDSLYQRRVLIRLIGVRFSHLVGGSYQIRLFEDSEKLVRLYQSMDSIRKRFGQQAVKRAVTMGVKAIVHSHNPFTG